MMIIGVTGISGSGTSTVTQILAEAGGFVVSADALSHALMRKGQPCYSEITACFGETIIGTDGEIDRRALGALVFNDVKRLAMLEAILHPRVIAQTKMLIAQSQAPFAVIDAPLLIEANMHTIGDSCWLVTAPHDVRICRIMARDHISYEAAERRLSARKGDAALRPYADVVIENDGDFNQLRKKTLAALTHCGIVAI